VKTARGQSDASKVLNVLLVFGLNVKSLFGLDSTIFILSILTACLADLHSSVPNRWEGDGIRQRLYSLPLPVVK
jgi:hypothetical protein